MHIRQSTGNGGKKCIYTYVARLYRTHTRATQTNQLHHTKHGLCYHSNTMNIFDILNRYIASLYYMKHYKFLYALPRILTSLVSRHHSLYMLRVLVVVVIPAAVLL